MTIIIVIFNSFKGPVMLASSQGGMSIEDVARENPDAIMTEAVSSYLSYNVDY